MIERQGVTQKRFHDIAIEINQCSAEFTSPGHLYTFALSLYAVLPELHACSRPREAYLVEILTGSVEG